MTLWIIHWKTLTSGSKKCEERRSDAMNIGRKSW
jgi:hypothetical protein